MDHISAFNSRTREWLQPKMLKHRYELQAGPAQLTTLAVHSVWDTLAIAVTADSS
jgi:hypothetical protein